VAPGTRRLEQVRHEVRLAIFTLEVDGFGSGSGEQNTEAEEEHGYQPDELAVMFTGKENNSGARQPAVVPAKPNRVVTHSWAGDRQLEETDLSKRYFVEPAAFVNPATILSLDAVPVSSTGVRLKHEGPVGGQHGLFGLVNGLPERGTRYIRIQALHDRRQSAPFLANITRAKEILHRNLC
jgi:hypothetical protein